MNVSNRVLDVSCEIADLASTVGPGEMVVHPSDQDLFRRQLHEFFQCLAFLQQYSEVGVHIQVDVTQQTNLQAKYKIFFQLHSDSMQYGKA